MVDRTDLAVIVKRSACYGDVAAYLTGARHRYGSFVIDPKLGDEWILLRRSTGTGVRIRLRPGIKPAELPVLEGRPTIDSHPGKKRRITLAAPRPSLRSLSLSLPERPGITIPYAAR